MSTPAIYGARRATPGTEVVRLVEAATQWQHQLIVTGSGAVSSAWSVYGTSDLTGVLGRRLICSLTASGTNAADDNTAAILHSWPCLVYVCDAITGNGAVAAVTSMGA